jgi:hypothetical protein
MAFWHVLPFLGIIWHYLALFGIIWHYLALFAIFGIFGLFWPFWPFWRFLAHQQFSLLVEKMVIFSNLVTLIIISLIFATNILEL